MATNTEALIKAYKDIQQRIIETIAYSRESGNVTFYQEQLLRQIEAELARLSQLTLPWANDTLPVAYSNGVQLAVDGLQALGVAASADGFALLHKRAVSLLIRNATADLTDSLEFVGRELTDIVRQAGLQAVAEKIGTGQTVKRAKNAIVSKLQQQGIAGIVDRAGRYIRLDAYAATVARSTTREATNTAMRNHMQLLGYDLVKMSSHATTCPVCAVLQGRVYSITGRTPGYPVLTRAFGSHANIHPNCRHVITPYIADLADDAAADREFSNKPFDIDPRSKAEIDRYNRDQTEKRQRRNDRDQFERYKLALGQDSPSTFASFRSIKIKDGERWQQLQLDYREARRQ